MNLENIIRVLMKIMGISEAQMRETFEKGQELVVDGHAAITDINQRLIRIETALGTIPTKDHTECQENQNQLRLPMTPTSPKQ
jgi:hypothetical protein